MSTELERIREQLAGITPGEWRLERDSPDDAPAIIVYSAISNGLITGTYITDLVEEESDAAFIAAAPSMVEHLLARLDALTAVADDLAERGDNLEARGNNGSIYSTRAEGRGIGYRESARLIRAAITEDPTP